MEKILLVMALCAIGGGIGCMSMAIDRLRGSFESESGKTQALLAEIRDRLGK
jgi:hypothetical protein